MSALWTFYHCRCWCIWVPFELRSPILPEGNLIVHVCFATVEERFLQEHFYELEVVSSIPVRWSTHLHEFLG